MAINPNNVPHSRYTLFFRGFFANVAREDIREFFTKEGGHCTFEFNRVSDDGRNAFVALKFDSHDVARDILNRFDGSYALGCRIYINWYKELRRHKPDDGAGGRGSYSRRISPSRSSFHYDREDDRRRNWRPAPRSRRYSGDRSTSGSVSPRARSHSPDRHRTRSKSGGREWRDTRSPGRRSWSPEERSRGVRSEVKRPEEQADSDSEQSDNDEESPKKKRRRSDEQDDKMSEDDAASPEKPSLNFSLKSKSTVQKSANIFDEDQNSDAAEPKPGIHRRGKSETSNTSPKKSTTIGQNKKKKGKMESELEDGEIISSHNMDDEWEEKTRKFIEEKCKDNVDTPASIVSPTQSLPVSNKSTGSISKKLSSQRSIEKSESSSRPVGRMPSPSRWESSRSRSRSRSYSSSSRSSSRSLSPPKAYRSRSRSRSQSPSSDERSPSPETIKKRTAGWLERWYKRRDMNRRKRSDEKRMKDGGKEEKEKKKKEKEKVKPSKKEKIKKKKKDKKTKREKKLLEKNGKGGYSSGSDGGIPDEDLLRIQGLNDSAIAKNAPKNSPPNNADDAHNAAIENITTGGGGGGVVGKAMDTEIEAPNIDTNVSDKIEEEEMEVNGNDSGDEDVADEESEDSVDMTSFDASAVVGLSTGQMKQLLEKKEEIEKAYRQDCETFATVVRMLISKDSKLEEQLQFSLKENLKELGKSCIVELRSYVEQLKQEGDKDMS